MRIFVLADDLTGANATASVLKREGLPSRSHLYGHLAKTAAPLSLHAEGVHVLDLDTRDRDDSEAAERVAAAAAQIGTGADLIGLRIDSTLRGPVPASLDTLLADVRRFALMVPAFPASGRTTRGGIHYVHGVPLDQTEVAHDPVCPVTSSSLAKWIGARLHVASAGLGLDEVRRGQEAIAARLADHVASGVRVAFCDAETDDDIERIARAALALAGRQKWLSLLPVDPGPFTAAVVRVMREPDWLYPQVFGISGSIMETSRLQMDFVEEGGHAFTVAYRGQPVAEIITAFERAPAATRALFLRTDAVRLDAVGRQQIYDRLGSLFEQVVDRFPSIGGFFLSGGETAGRILAAFGVRTLHMQSEVLPLISLSRIADGRLSGAALVTKGGAVGEDSAIVEALRRIFEVLADGNLREEAAWSCGAQRTSEPVAL